MSCTLRWTYSRTAVISTVQAGALMPNRCAVRIS
jgi:hypothetical protein